MDVNGGLVVIKEVIKYNNIKVALKNKLFYNVEMLKTLQEKENEKEKENWTI